MLAFLRVTGTAVKKSCHHTSRIRHHMLHFAWMKTQTLQKQDSLYGPTSLLVVV